MRLVLLLLPLPALVRHGWRLGIFIYEVLCFQGGQKLALNPATPHNNFSPFVGSLGDRYEVMCDWWGCFCSDPETRMMVSCPPASLQTQDGLRVFHWQGKLKGCWKSTCWVWIYFISIDFESFYISLWTEGVRGKDGEGYSILSTQREENEQGGLKCLSFHASVTFSTKQPASATWVLNLDQISSAF